MDNILTICFHQILGLLYSISDKSSKVILVIFTILFIVGLIRAFTYWVSTLKSTAILRKNLDGISVRTSASDMSTITDPEIFVNVVPDEKTVTAFTLGFLKPEIYLTSGLIQKFDPDELAIVIHHESGHCARRDPLRSTIIDALSELLWFIPFVGKHSDRLKIAAELACDTVAVENGYARNIVAGLLLKVAKGPNMFNPTPTPAFSSIMDQLEIRVRSLLGENILAVTRIPLKIILASSLIVFSILLSSSAAITTHIDPGGLATSIQTTSEACTDGHPENDILQQFGISCPHCGPDSPNESPDPTCHVK